MKTIRISSTSFPLRTIHLDFHTGPAIHDVGRDFDPDEFADTFVRANVDCVTVFAKCHHGHLYYDTAHPARHPGLKAGLDLLGEQIEALHRRGIRAPVYLSVLCDEWAADNHPDWIAVDHEGKLIKRFAEHLAAGWQILDMASPYQDYLAEQFAEVLKKYRPLDGVFFDMCWDQPSCSKYSYDAMRKRGLDPRIESDRLKFAAQISHEYRTRFNKMFQQAQKNPGIGVWYNGRPKADLLLGGDKYVHHVEVESLPTGGWGYSYFPYVSRFVRPLGMPALSHTARFHKSWADFGGLKPEAALKYECCTILAQGMTSGIGDQMHPRGTLDRPAYEMIGRVYGHLKACEPFVVGGKLLSQIAVLTNPRLGDEPGFSGVGFTRALRQLRHQFDILPPTANFNGYELVIVPEIVRIDPPLRHRLRAYLKSGGALLVVGASALNDAGEPAMTELGIRVHGQSQFTTTYLRPRRQIADGIAPMDHAMYLPGFRMTPARGAVALCDVVEPYFERSREHFCSHRQTPPDKKSRYAAVVQKGRVITISVPIFAAFGQHGNVPYRQIIGNCINLLLPRPLIRDRGPVHLETSVVQKDDRIVVHLLSYAPASRTNVEIIEDPMPLVDVPIAVKLARRPTRASLQPHGQKLDFDYRDGYAHVRVTLLDGHGMLVFE